MALSAKPFSMPTACDPCPGKTNANLPMLFSNFDNQPICDSVPESHPRQHSAPGKAAANAFHHDVLARLDTTIPHADVERHRNGGCRRVAVLIDGDNHLVHAQAEL